MQPALTATYRRYRYEVFAATWLSYAGFYICRKVFGIVKAPMKEALGVDDLTLSHLWTSYLIAYMIGQFMTAGLGSRLTGRTLLLIGMGVTVAANFGVGSLLPFGSEAYNWLLLVMFAHGLAQATGWGANVGIMANWTFREERGRVMAWWTTCYQLGAVIAKAFAAFMFGWLGLSWSYWGASIVFMAIWVLFYFWGRERPESVNLPAIPEEDVSDNAAQPKPAVAPNQVWPFIIAMGLIYFSFKFLRYALDSWSALILKEQFALATTTAGYLSTAYDWIGFLGVLAGGYLSDRVFGGRRTPVIFWMAVGGLGASLLMWGFGTTSVASFVVILGLLGFMSMGPDSLLSAAGAMDVGSRRMALIASAVINGLGSIGPIIQEPVIGYLKTTGGNGSVFGLLVGVAVLSAVGSGLLWLGVRRSGATL